MGNNTYKSRSFNLKFWDDEYIQSLKVEEKFLFLYLLTNSLTNIVGVYEISIKKINNNTCLSEELIESILRKFNNDKKIFYLDNKIIIKNFLKYQPNNIKIKKGISTILNNFSTEFIDKLLCLIPELDKYLDIKIANKRDSKIRNIIDDNGQNCDLCGNFFKKKDLIVHHKKPLFNDGNNKRNNLFILCDNCHEKEHKKIGYDMV